MLIQVRQGHGSQSELTLGGRQGTLWAGRQSITGLVARTNLSISLQGGDYSLHFYGFLCAYNFVNCIYNFANDVNAPTPQYESYHFM